MLYLGAVRNLREGLGQPFRRRLRNAIAKVAADEAPEAAVAHFHLVLLELEGKLLSAFRELETVRRDQIESVATVLAGEPEDMNSLDAPEKVAPQTMTLTGVGNTFVHEFPAHSVTVLRVKARK